MGRDQIGHYQFHIESCRSKPALQSRSSVQHSLAPTKSNSPQRITRRRSKGSGGEVREVIRGRPGGDADPQLKERSRWPTEGCWGNLLNPTVVEDDASISLRRCLAGALQKRACRCWHGGVAPPASKWLAVTPPAVGVDCRCTTRKSQPVRLETQPSQLLLAGAAVTMSVRAAVCD